MLDHARTHHPAALLKRVKTFQGSAFSIGLSANAVDCIFCLELFRHVPSSDVRMALLREFHGQANQPTLQAAGLHLDEGRQCVLRDGAEIQLTAAEFRLLRYFMLHPEQILSKSHLAEHLYDGETERDSNVLEVHVNHLRRKLGRSVIETRRGQGYRFGASPA